MKENMLYKTTDNQRLFWWFFLCSMVSGVIPGEVMLPSRVGGCGPSARTRFMRGNMTLMLC